jgi:hypothetical protein
MTEVAEGSDSLELRPLLRRDPPAVGDIRLIGRIGDHDAGMTYIGQLMLDDHSPTEADGEDADAGSAEAADAAGTPVTPEVTVVMLTSGAEADSYARARFRQAVDDLDHDRPSVIVSREEEDDLAPWVAFTAASRIEGLAVSERLLMSVTLENQVPVGTVQGPGFRPHWWQRVGVGRWRLWPLPWPSSLSSASRWTFLASFAVICALAALALWIAVLVFRHQPPPAPGPGPGPGPNPPSTSPTPSPTPPNPGPSPNPSGPTGRTVPPIV